MDLGVPAGALANHLAGESVYKVFDESGLAYGEPLRCIESFYWGETAALGRLTRRVDYGHPECFPGLMDAAIQCALLWVRQTRADGRVWVPFSLAELIVQEAPGPKCLCITTINSQGSDDAYYSFDIRLTDENGRPLVEMRDLCVRPFVHAEAGERDEINMPRTATSTLWAVASTFTAEPIEEPLTELCRRSGWDVRIEFAPYNQVFQELLNPESLLSQNRSGVNILPIRLEDFQARTVSPSGGAIGNAEPFPEGQEKYRLPNGLEIAHLNSYETRYLYDEIFVRRTYLNHGIELEEGDVVFDIGANIGMFSMFVAAQCENASIYACEPSPVTFDVLRRNLAMHAPRAKALPFGVADEDRESTFVFYPKSSVFSGFHADERLDGFALRRAMENEVAEALGPQNPEALRAHLDLLTRERLRKETHTCRLRSLSSLILEHGIQTIGLLKIDAEKCEWDILRGIDAEDWAKIRQVAIEVHDGLDGDLCARITELLRGKGFEVAAVEEELLKGSRLFNLYGKRPAGYGKRAAGNKQAALEKGIRANLEDWVGLLRRSAANWRGLSVVVVCPPSPEIEARLPDGFLQTTEAWLRETLAADDGVHVLSMADYASVYQWGDCHDAVRYDMGRIPYTPRFFHALAGVVARRLHAARREPYKVIALDCDNTLWAGADRGKRRGGGSNSAKASETCRLSWQRGRQPGMLLCLVSKNDPADVRRVFETRADMILKWEDFAAFRINWEAKSENLKSLARSLELGLDSFIFLDDSPVECAEVRAHCPLALTLQLPAQPHDFPAFLSHVWAFDQPRSTAEDGRRTELYRQRERREEFRREAPDFAEFIASLALNIQIAEPQAGDFSRLSQLTKRTNQFNFAKRPQTEAELRSVADARSRGCLAVRVSDRFGDYGLCGLACFEAPGEACGESRTLRVDALLLSCRALGRGVEHAMMAALGRHAIERGASRVEAVFLRSEKNLPAERFLAGLECLAKRREGEAEIFVFDAGALSVLKFTPPAHEPEQVEETEPAAANVKPRSDSAFMQTIADACGFPEPENHTDSTRHSTAAPKSEAPPGDALQRIESIVMESVRGCLRVQQAAIDPLKPFSEYGIGSMENIKLVVTLNETFGVVLPATTLFDYVCVSDLSGYIHSNYPEAVERLMTETAKVQPGTATGPEPAAPASGETAHESRTEGIAVIGIAGRFPRVRDGNAFWKLLREGGSTISEVPSKRWNLDAHYDADRTAPDKTYGRHGGFLEDIDCFDAAFFGISGRAAQQMDPQQRVFLEEAWHALEDAGYARRATGPRNWGVFAGADSGDYQAHLRKAGLPLDPSSFMGNDASILAARIAYFLNLTGPALTVDTASSSSLTAVHLACVSLRSGEVDLALAGGVSIHVTPNFHILCSKAGMLSADGKCKVFDDSADGFVPGEAAGVVALKRLADAVRDGDSIYAVIRGSGVNQDGRTNGITAPSSLSQARLIQDVYRKFGVDAAEIGYVEAHGTGTRLGDPVEIKALTDAFRAFTDRKQQCAIGSVKSNIGHCVHASGVCGLIKLVLALHHRAIPPSINFSKPNQHIAFESSPFFVNTKLRDWEPNAQGARIGASSSFGFSGTNVHMVVEDFAAAERTAGDEPGPQLFCFRQRAPASARGRRGLARFSRRRPRAASGRSRLHPDVA